MFLGHGNNTIPNLQFHSLLLVPPPNVCFFYFQRQTIELIPVTRVSYTWKGKSHIYFVYGNEFQVNADDYPATCCCTVM